MVEKKQVSKEIQVSIPEQLKGGVYCNYMLVTHTKEEFIMDFMMVTPPMGAIVSRVIMNPSHMKRTIKALTENLEKYESKIQPLEEAPAPAQGRIGFQTT